MTKIIPVMRDPFFAMSSTFRGLDLRSFGEDYWNRCEVEGRFPEEFWEHVSALRLPGAILSEGSGGLGWGLRELTELVTEVVGSGAGLGVYPLISNNLAGMVVESAAGDVHREFLRGLSSGRYLCGLAVTEEHAGSDPSAIATRATEVGSGYVIEGRKFLVANLTRATHYLVLCRTSDPEGGKWWKGLTLFLVEKSGPGVRFVTRPSLAMGHLPVGELELTGCRVGREHVIGEPGNGWAALSRALTADRIVYGAVGVGMAELALKRALEWARSRRAFGRTIGSNQGIQFPLASLFSRIRALRTYLLHVAERFDGGEGVEVDAMAAKYLGAELAMDAVSEAMRVHAGHGFLKGTTVERLAREVWVLMAGPVTQEIALAYIAHRGLGLPSTL